MAGPGFSAGVALISVSAAIRKSWTGITVAPPRSIIQLELRMPLDTRWFEFPNRRVLGGIVESRRRETRWWIRSFPLDGAPQRFGNCDRLLEAKVGANSVAAYCPVLCRV